MEPFMTHEANHKTLFMMAMTCEVTVMIVKCNIIRPQGISSLGGRMDLLCVISL